MKKERWFNYRPLCLVFIMLLLGSIFAFYCFYDKQNYLNNHLSMILSLVGLLVVIVIIIIFAIRNKSIKFMLVPLIALLVGIGVFCISLENFKTKEFVSPNVVSARIFEITDNGAVKMIYADNMYFDGIKAKGTIVFSIYDYSYQFDGIEIGRQIKVKPTKITTTDLLNYKIPSSTYFKMNIKYKATAQIEDVEIGDIRLTVAEKIKQKVKSVLFMGLSNENANLTYSALFGDKTELQHNTKDAFKLSGISHLLAVSGLHVGIIVSLINWICKKLKIKNWFKIVLIAVFLLFYMYLCDFSSSIVRATIMSIILLIAPIACRQYDSLSAIGLAGIICFLINPLFAFDAGSIMSFGCVLGITLFNRPINKIFAKTKMPQWICQSLSITASTMVSLLFVMAYYFQTINLVSLIANVILIPLFTIGFIFSFIVGFLGLIIKPIGILLVPINYLFNFISLVANVLGNLPFANLTTTSVDYISIVVYYILLILMSRITVAKPEHKLAVILPTVAILVAVMV